MQGRHVVSAVRVLEGTVPQGWSSSYILNCTLSEHGSKIIAAIAAFIRK